MSTETTTPPPAQAVERHRSTGALAVQSDQEFWTEQQQAALVQLGLGDAPKGDLAVFLTYAQRTGLDPWARQLYMIGRNTKVNGQWTTKYTIQASIDGLRIVAQRTGDYAGQVGPEWCGPDGVWRDVWLFDVPPAAARVGVLRRGWTQAQFAVAVFREYAGTDKDGNLTRMWADKPALMIAKCAEALALRKAFPQDLSGVYTADEMSRADVVAGEVVPQQHRQQQTQQQAPPPEPLDADALRDALLTAPSRASLRVALIGLGAIVVREGRDSWQNHRLAATQVADAQGEPTDALTLARTIAAALPADDPTPEPATSTDDDVAQGELMDEENQTW